MNDPFEPPSQLVTAGPSTEDVEFDVAIAKAVMRTTWGSAVAAAGFCMVQCFCNPAFIFTMLSIGGGLNAVLRVVQMDARLRHYVGAEAVAAASVGGFFGALSMLYAFLLCLGLGSLAI
jgi:hypothetical protein